MKKILIVEDDPMLSEVYGKKFEKAGDYEVLKATSGTETLEKIKKHKPDLVLLDLNLPRKDGREVLAEIKGDAKLKSIPVVVLTTSRNEDDITQSYNLHVNCYITKSRNLSELFRIVKGIEEFWLGTATLPLSEKEVS
ncbi:MAG: response regulator [Spirulinaceae cyanobacterium]